MPVPKKITVTEATAILTSTIIGVGVLPLPLFAVRAGYTAAPLVTLMGILTAFLALFILVKLGIRHPTKSIIEYSEDILGKWGGRIGSFFIIAFFAVLTALGAREFGAVVVSAVLKETPVEVTVIVMLFLTAASSRNNLITFSYIHTFYLPIILAPGIIVVALSLKNANILYLQPLLGNNFIDMVKGSFIIAALFQGSFVISIIIPMMKQPQKAIKASWLAILISGALYLMIVIAALAVFGPEEIKKLLWPTLELARTTSLPGNILQRLDVVFLTVWVTAVFTTLFSSYTFTCHALSNLFKLNDHKLFSMFLLPFIFIIAMIPTNTLQMYEIIQLVGIVGLFLTIGYPALLLIIDLLRKRG